MGPNVWLINDELTSADVRIFWSYLTFYLPNYCGFNINAQGGNSRSLDIEVEIRDLIHSCIHIFVSTSKSITREKAPSGATLHST